MAHTSCILPFTTNLPVYLHLSSLPFVPVLNFKRVKRFGGDIFGIRLILVD